MKKKNRILPQKSRDRQIGRRLPFALRLHFWLMVTAFVGYTLLSFSLGPRFFFSDVLHKMRVIADDVIVVTAVVLGPPAQPVVTATPVCVSGSPRVNLNWADDQATSTWDIDRDSVPLITGLIVSQYTDATVANATAYSYVVTANGPMFPGTAVSVPVSVTTLNCPALQPDPTLTITTIGGENVAVNRSNITIEDSRPTITGTTNIPNAIIDITLTNPSVVAQVTANVTGYFEWTPPTNLNDGTHTLSVTATDPLDGTRVVTDSLVFSTDTEDEDGDDDDDDEDKRGGIATPREPSPTAPFDFRVSIGNEGLSLRQGEELEYSVESLSGPFPLGTTFEFLLIGERGKEVYRLPETTVTDQNQSVLLLSAFVPKSIDPGTYRLRASALFSGVLVSREAPFVLSPLPLFRLGEGVVITYPEVVSFVGWIFFLLLFLFLLFLLLFLREYWLYAHSIKHITERELARLGFLGSRKGVMR